MAASRETIIISDSSDESISEEKPNIKESDPIECPICLQKCIHPARLPCGHIFCFLCVKGVAYKNKRCAMCRRDIPLEFLDHPQLVNGIDELKKSLNSDEGYQWFYEGRNGGWWEYDERTTELIESEYVLDSSNTIDALVCGRIYCINFSNFTQYPKEQPTRNRRIKRELKIDKRSKFGLKGIAGWWQYDERTSQELEDAYKNQEKSCSILVAGFVYTIDFVEMLQLRKNDPSRQRRVKRDLSSIPKKGVAGLRIDSNNTIVTSNVEERLTNTTSTNMAGDSINNLNSIVNRDNFISPIAVTDAAVRIVSNIIDSTLAHANLDETQNRRINHIRNIFESIPTSISPTELIENNLESFNESSSPSTLSNNNNNNNNSRNRNNLNHDSNVSFEILEQAEELLELNSPTSTVSTQSPRLSNVCIFSQTIDGFRNLTLRNVMDSSDSEDDNEHIIL